MPLTTALITPADAAQLAPLDYDSWLTPYNPQLKHFRPAFSSRDDAISWFIASRTPLYEAQAQDPAPKKFFVKCYEPATGEIAGYAVWAINDGGEGEGGGKTQASWHPEGSEEREFAERFVDGLWGFIGERVRGARMDLHALLVHPAHRNRGAARQLLAWGTSKADALGIPTVISSLPSARGAYEKCGFGAIEVIPPHASLDEVEGRSARWEEWRSEDLRGWLMWRPVGRDWVEGDWAPWVKG